MLTDTPNSSSVSSICMQSVSCQLQLLPCFWCASRYAAPVYCDIKHLVMVTEEDGSKVEESSVKHEKIFLGEVYLEWTMFLHH